MPPPPPNPRVLALDASTALGIAVLAEGTRPVRTVTVHRDRHPGGKHARALVPALQQAFQQQNWNPRSLQAVAVGVGPGSFTGLRVATTLAKTAAALLRIPLHTLDSLEILALSLWLQDPDARALAKDPAARIVAVADALRGEVYSAQFRVLPHEPHPPQHPIEPETLLQQHFQPLERVAETRIQPLPDLLESLPEPASRVVAPEETRLDQQPHSLPELWRQQRRWTNLPPDPRALAALAHRAVQREQPVDPPILEPLYLRPSGAEERHPRGLPPHNL